MLSFSPPPIPQDARKLAATLCSAQEANVASGGTCTAALEFIDAVHRHICSPAHVQSDRIQTAEQNNLISQTASILADQYRNADSIEKSNILRTFWATGFPKCSESASIFLDIIIQGLNDGTQTVRDEAAFCLAESLYAATSDAPLSVAIETRFDDLKVSLRLLIDRDAFADSSIEGGSASDFAYGILKRFEEPYAHRFNAHGLHITAR
jgi:hypothetical protein